ncbi:uncharacterized protein GGS22DRAFT_158392 [Annulohypoxylon maeteangense]|uniref:uncharacterized protein n=1 Tax=Annulohypoxylon maeteangense TaxID=1927788 RepID=UPI0020086721|nr:uncharacterized protein GGS22DRAFT_158392 [Annulohypoxylon maeteangense]KAI0886668.1 hypothetical protein GGS22DRAFT_158392 [Annulohypoxylon maeteangense]
MASQDQSFNSNNPFRRKLGTPTISTENPAAIPATSFDGHFDSIPRVPFTSFKSDQPNNDRREREDNEEVVPAPPKPKKVVKRVRVQSPPPSSPEDAVPVARFPPISDDEDEDDNEDDDDDSNSSDSEDHDEHIGRYKTVSFPARDNDSVSTEHTQTGPPPNPFSKTLQDLEQTGQDQDTSIFAAGATAKGALDVDSFKRLLLTGYANIPGPSSTSASGTGGNSGLSTNLHASLHDGASNTDASSVSRQSIFDAISDTPRTSHEISEPEDPEERRSILPTSPLSSMTSSSTRKKPPPPSSRHGKLIKIELGADADSRTTKTSTAPISISTTSLPSIAPPRKSNLQPITAPSQSPLSTDVNKPLPLTPFRPSVEEAVDSPFDREAIGKGPEPFADIQSNPRPPTPPVVTRNRSASNGSTQTRKPAAPPPRRHGRSDSRAPSIHTGNQDDDTPPRSSLDSNRSRTDSIRTSTINAPAPPPPRRPNHARQGSSFTSPSQASFTPIPALGPGIGESLRSPTGSGFGPTSSTGPIEDPGAASLATITTSKDGQPKLSPPPPPPTRSASTRRPPSVRSMDAGNGLGTGTTRRVSKEKEGVAIPPPPPPPPRQRGSSRASVETPAPPATDGVRNPSGKAGQGPTAAAQPEGDVKQGAEILADIDALQREVDALMGRVGKTGN